MNVKKVGSVQINNGFAGQFYLPYSIGTLVAYFKEYSENSYRYEFSLPIYKRWLLDECVEHLKDDDIILFSVYVWNINISLKIAETIKKNNPEKFIIFGGPSVPDDAKIFLKDNNFIDCAVHQEGERTITNLLDKFPNDKWTNVSGISCYKNNKFINNPNLPKMRDISKLPSPYLTGFFDNLIKKNPNEHWLASWETNRGCPFSCAFCDWGSATASKVSRMDLDKLQKELNWFAEHKIEFIYVCDANFGILPRDFEIAKMAIETKKKYGYPHVLSVQTTKNARDRSYKIQKLLHDAGMHKSINLAMQSTNPKTLKEIKRDNISIEDYKVLQKKFIEDEIPTYSDLIIGLPGDTYDTFKKSVDELVDAGQHYRIQFNNLSILPNAEMAKPYYMEKNQIKVVEIPIVNQHGSLDETPSDGIVERQETVVSTLDMPKDEWIKTRVFSTAIEFYYFNKMLQVPILLLSKICKKKISNFIDYFLSIKSNKYYPVISYVNQIILDHAKGILNGKPEFIYSKDYLNIYWPPGEFAMLKLVDKDLISGFYNESENLLKKLIDNKSLNLFIEDCIQFNWKTLKKPMKFKNEEIVLNHDIPNIYKKAKLGNEIKILNQKIKFTILSENQQKYDFHNWAQKVVWYGHRKANYLYETNQSKLEN